MTYEFDPDYLEAFAAFEMEHAGKRPLRSREVTWFNQHRAEIGHGEVAWSDYTLDFRYHLDASLYAGQNSGRRIARVAPISRGSHSFRFHVLCRTCGNYVYRLFFRTEDWLCKDCQHLRNRSSFLSPQLRWQEEYDQLRYEIGDGRPFRMREAQYAKKAMRMAALRPKLDGRRRRPGPEFHRLVFAEWTDIGPTK